MDRKATVQISPAACIFLALSLLILPLKWLFAAIIAASFHEMCHAFAVYLCYGQVYHLDLGARGAKMKASPLSRLEELFCVLAGPIGGLLLLLFFRWIPRIALCAGFQSLYNLLPIYPLDGGRALRCGIEIILSEQHSLQVCAVVEALCLAAIICLSVYGALVLNLGIGALIPAIIIVIHTKYGKTPCKERL